MARKQGRSNHFKNFQGPSTTSSAASGGSSGPSTSVNEQLNALRRAEPAEAAHIHRDLAATVNQRSVPPHLRSILGVPESAPPKPKPGTRVRERLRYSGPAPPQSWLQTGTLFSPSTSGLHGVGLRKGLRRGKRRAAEANSLTRARPKDLLRFATLTGLEKSDVGRESPPKLSHLTLKKIARDWDLIDEEDYSALIGIPLRLRLRLLSYIDYHGPALTIAALHAIVQGGESVDCLDLASLVGHRDLSVKRIARMIEDNRLTAASSKRFAMADAWDDDDVSLETFPSPPGQPASALPFAHLTHLSLSHPSPSGASWRSLLALAKQIPQLTHLSLAHWPRPSLTPNLTSATVSTPHAPEVHAGASHLYSGLDQDFSEPASLLRQLSAHLLRLVWLDLEGCTAWAPALRTLAEEASAPSSQADGWQSDQIRPQPLSVFVTTWSRLTHIRLQQGWQPTRTGLRMLAAAEIVRNNLDAPHRLPGLPDVSADMAPDALQFEAKRAQIWLAAERELAAVGVRINTVRRAHHLPRTRVELDWAPQAVRMALNMG